jgi:hypothetical protein
VRRALSVYPERRAEATPERMAHLLEATRSRSPTSRSTPTRTWRPTADMIWGAFQGYLGGSCGSPPRRVTSRSKPLPRPRDEAISQITFALMLRRSSPRPRSCPRAWQSAGSSPGSA